MQFTLILILVLITNLTSVILVEQSTTYKLGTEAREKIRVCELQLKRTDTCTIMATAKEEL